MYEVGDAFSFYIQLFLNLLFLHVQNSKWGLHGCNKWEECCHFGTSGWVFTLWVRCSRATNVVPFSDGLSFLFWLRLIASTSALMNYSAFSSPVGQICSIFCFWICYDFHQHCSGFLQFRGTGWYLIRPHASAAQRGGRGSPGQDRTGRMICRLKMNAGLFCLCATSMRLITQLLMTFLAEPRWWDCFNAKWRIASPSEHNEMRGQLWRQHTADCCLIL